jgi:hypothetical protein
MAIAKHGARAALADAATVFRAVQLQLVAQSNGVSGGTSRS